jgi:hypothetical protein
MDTDICKAKCSVHFLPCIVLFRESCDTVAEFLSLANRNCKIDAGFDFESFSEMLCFVLSNAGQGKSCTLAEGTLSIPCFAPETSVNRRKESA